MSGNIPFFFFHTSVKHADTSRSGSEMHPQKEKQEKENIFETLLKTFEIGLSVNGAKVISAELSAALTRWRHLLWLIVSFEPDLTSSSFFFFPFKRFTL